MLDDDPEKRPFNEGSWLSHCWGLLMRCAPVLEKETKRAPSGNKSERMEVCEGHLFPFQARTAPKNPLRNKIQKMKDDFGDHYDFFDLTGLT